VDKRQAGREGLVGGSGSDTLSGGGASDRINGQNGNDTLTGGGGGDVFLFTKNSKNGFDTITDFDARRDKIDLSDRGRDQVSVTIDNGNTIIDYGRQNEITLEGVQLSEDDIAFI